MIDSSFIDLLSDDNIKKINIDPRLIEPFRNIMKKMQEYFNTKGYTLQRNYKEFFEKFLLSEISDKLKIIIDNEPSKIGASGIYRHNDQTQEIHIDEKYLNTQYCESTLCHEFIHFLVMRDLHENGFYDNEIKDGGFINEALTEMLTQQMYPNSRSYEPQVEMLKFANLLTGNVNNYSLFLRGHVDSRQGASSWLNFYNIVQKYQRNFSNKGFYLNEALTDMDYIAAQRYIIEANMHTHLINDFQQYVDFISKLNERVIPDDEWIENFIAKAEKNLSKKYGNTREIERFITDKLKEYRNLLALKEKYNGKDVIEVEVGGKKIAFDKEGNVFDQDTGKKYYGNHQIGYYGNIRQIIINGDKKEIDLSNSGFSKRKEDIENKLKEVSKFFSKNLYSDLNIFKENINTENLVKIERFELPDINDSKNRKSNYIYVATHEDHIEILDSKKTSNETVHNHLHFSFKGINPSGNEIYMSGLEPIEYGVVFSKMNEKTLSNGIKNMMYQELQKSNPEISEEELYDIVDEKYQGLNEEELKRLESQVVTMHPKYIVSTKDGEIDVSIINGISAISGIKKEVLVNTKTNATYNKYFEETQRSNIGKKNMESIILPIDLKGNIVKVKTDSVDSTEAELFEENLPYGVKKEEEKTSSFPKFKPVEQTKHHDFVQESSPKQQESKSKFQNIDDKKKKQESQKRKDDIEDLKRMQEMVEMARQQKIQQDLINSQEEMEEDQGMSL